MKLLILRHGECQANVDGLVAGSRVDSPLTSVGEQEAREVAARLAGTKPSAIIASPLTRAHRTAEIIRELIAPDLEVEIMPAFIELDVGVATGLPLEEYFALEKTGKPIPQAETPDHVLARVSNGLNQLALRSGTVLLVSHNGTCRMIECAINGWPADKFAELPGLNNGEIREFELSQ